MTPLGQRFACVRRAYRRLPCLLTTRRALFALLALAVLVYWIEALAWPIQRGRDGWDYIIYYLSLFDRHTPFPQVMLFRTPVTPVFLGVPLSIGGVTALEIALSLLYAFSILFWSLAALRFSRLGAVLTALALLAYPGYGAMYHEASSDCVTAFLFSLFAFWIVRTMARPGWRGFAVLGAGVALLALTRPVYLVLVATCVLPLAARAAWRSRLRWTAICVAFTVVPLASWATLNSLRYGDFTISRLGSALSTYAPFKNGEYSVENGPASRELGRLIEREVLTLPQYRRLHVDTTTYFHAGSNYEALRLCGISDHTFGLDSDYKILHDAAREAKVKKHRFRILGVAPWLTAERIRAFLTRPVRHEDRSKPDTWPRPNETYAVEGGLVPNPAALPPPLQAVSFGTFFCATDELSRCVLKNPGLAYADAGQARRYREITDKLSEWDKGLGARDPQHWLAVQIDRVARVYPPPWLWLLLGALALVVRRPRNSRTLVAITLAAGLVVAGHAAAIDYVAFYSMPVLPAMVLLAICSLTGERGLREEQARDGTGEEQAGGR